MLKLQGCIFWTDWEGTRRKRYGRAGPGQFITDIHHMVTFFFVLQTISKNSIDSEISYCLKVWNFLWNSGELFVWLQDGDHNYDKIRCLDVKNVSVNWRHDINHVSSTLENKQRHAFELNTFSTNNIEKKSHE